MMEWWNDGMMAENCWSGLAGHSWKWQEMAGMAGMAVNGWKWLGMAGNG